MKRFALFILFFVIMNSSAHTAQSCFNLFIEPGKNNAQVIQNYAAQIDYLNTKYNNIIFDKKLAEVLNPDLGNTAGLAKMRARYQAFKLRRILKNLKSTDRWEAYDFENFAKKLEGLAFLADSSVLKKMSSSDRILFRQAQHSLLSKGLENYFFDAESKASQSMKRKVFNFIITPFKDIYMRWTYAMFAAPKLNGAILPVEIAAKIAWEGLDHNRELLRPYQKNIYFKGYFNIFSTFYNWTVVSALFIGLPAYSYYAYTEMKAEGEAQVALVFDPLVQHSKEVSETDYHQLAIDKSMVYFLEEFKLKYNREPTPEELEMIKVIIAKKS